MIRYHINPDTGEVGVCYEPCKYGEATAHFTDALEAMEASVRFTEDQQNPSFVEDSEISENALDSEEAEIIEETESETSIAEVDVNAPGDNTEEEHEETPVSIEEIVENFQNYDEYSEEDPQENAEAVEEQTNEEQVIDSEEPAYESLHTVVSPFANLAPKQKTVEAEEEQITATEQEAESEDTESVRKPYLDTSGVEIYSVEGITLAEAEEQYWNSVNAMIDKETTGEETSVEDFTSVLELTELIHKNEGLQKASSIVKNHIFGWIARVEQDSGKFAALSAIATVENLSQQIEEGLQKVAEHEQRERAVWRKASYVVDATNEKKRAEFLESLAVLQKVAETSAIHSVLHTLTNEAGLVKQSIAGGRTVDGVDAILAAVEDALIVVK